MGLYFEDFSVGQKVITEKRTITENDIMSFAALSGDDNRIHTDAEFARIAAAIDAPLLATVSDLDLSGNAIDPTRGLDVLAEQIEDNPTNMKVACMMVEMLAKSVARRCSVLLAASP